MESEKSRGYSYTQYTDYHITFVVLQNQEAQNCSHYRRELWLVVFGVIYTR